MKVACLLVTCSMEQTRDDILQQVVQNLQEQAPELRETLTVFDNASTFPGTTEMLRKNYENVFRCDINVGYWTAIDWWLNERLSHDSEYVYVIESDLIHRRFDRLYECAGYLDVRPSVGGVRLHAYDVANKHLYDKDLPVAGSKRHIWRSHTNTVTQERVELTRDIGDIHVSNFNAHVPALNRRSMMVHAFKKLRSMPNFSEHDFQRACHECYQQIAILDGGIFDELAVQGGDKLTGSYLTSVQIAELGYYPTRFSLIVPRDMYEVRWLT